MDKISFLREITLKKMDFIGSLTNALMLWWVSSIIFCGSALAGAFLYRAQLNELKWLKVIFFIFMTTFVFCISQFGFLMIRRIRDAKQQVVYAMNKFDMSEHVPVEFQLVIQGTTFGSWMFIGLTILWAVLGVYTCWDLFSK